MLKKTVKYVDYNGNERVEDFYFNLSKAELSDMNWSTAGGLGQMLQDIISAQDIPKIAAIFKDIVLRSYGVKSADGRRFIKSKELSTEFSQTEAYSIIYMELANDEKMAAAFINGIVPDDVKTEVEEKTASKVKNEKNA